MFVFSLEKLLNKRKREESEVLMKLNRVRAEIEQRKRKVEELENSVKESYAYSGNMLKTGRYSLSIFQQSDNFALESGKTIEVTQEEIGKLTTIEDAIQAQYTEAYKKRKILESLKTKKFEEYKLERKKRENKFFDEVAINHTNYNVRNNV